MHQLSSFCALCFAIFPDEVELLILVLQTFSWKHSPIYFVCSPLSSLQPFLSRTGQLVATSFTWNISKHLFLLLMVYCYTFFVVNGILLHIGLNLWHSPVLQSQTSNFPYSLKRSGSCVKQFSLKNFILSLNEAPKAHRFCFLLLIQHSAVQRKSNKATLPNTKNFFNCKTRVVRIIAVFIASQYFFSFQHLWYCNCWKSLHNLWTLPNHNSRSLEDLDFRACHSASAQSFYRPVFKTKRSGGTTGKCSLWDDG